MCSVGRQAQMDLIASFVGATSLLSQKVQALRSFVGFFVNSILKVFRSPEIPTINKKKKSIDRLTKPLIGSRAV